MSAPLDASVVVCAYNGAGTLDRCLEALEKQTFSGSYEVIVVDDGSEDETAAIAVAREVRLVRHPINLGLGAARATGVESASGGIVCFTDADCVPDHHWLEALVSAYDEEPGIVGVGGLIESLDDQSLTQHYLVAHPPHRPVELTLARRGGLGRRALVYAAANTRPAVIGTRRRVTSFAGANMSFRRAALMAMGSFDGSIRFGSDDEDVCRRMRETNGPTCLCFEPDAVVLHPDPRRLRDMLRRSAAYGEGLARVFWRRQTTWPTFFPAPVVVALVALWGLRRKGVWRALVLPLACFPRWPLEALATRRVEPLSFAYIQLLEEAASDLGFLRASVRRLVRTTSGEER